MSIVVTAEQTVHVGTPIVVEGAAPGSPFAAVFEDDGSTGYFYALDTRGHDQPIQDALQIYNVSNVTDRGPPSVVKISWSQDSTKTVLLINEHPHAVFDFAAKRGYCRTGFPPPASGGSWSLQGHAWAESALGLFV